MAKEAFYSLGTSQQLGRCWLVKTPYDPEMIADLKEYFTKRWWDADERVWLIRCSRQQIEDFLQQHFGDNVFEGDDDGGEEPEEDRDAIPF